MDLAASYYDRLAAAYVRGMLSDTEGRRHPALFDRPLDELATADRDRLLRIGTDQGLRLHRFKRMMDLPRVRKVLGILKGVQPRELLDIGSGRGAFLWPLLDAFPHLPVTAIDRLDHRVEAIRAVQRGGVSQVCGHRMDAVALMLADGSFDAVTALEVLEHIPEVGVALQEICRVARRFVVVSVPSRPDDNPEHLHLIDETTLRRLLEAGGASGVQFDAVHNHRIVVARMAERG